MKNGIVKWFSEQKGYGFIEQEDGKNDIFVHHTGITGEGYRAIFEGDRVTFDVQETTKGLNAINVTKI